MPDEYNSSYTGAEIDAAIGKARSIEANPTLAGTESSLTGLQIGSTKYKVDGGSGKADKTDLTSIIATGSTNATGATITAGTFFYLNGTLVQAKTDIANGATFTSGTNYEIPTAGALNALKSALGVLETDTIVTETYGTLNYVFSPALHICMISWAGNGNTPPDGYVQYDAPNIILAQTGALVPMFNGDYLSIDGFPSRKITVRTNGNTWSNTSLLYFTV